MMKRYLVLLACVLMVMTLCQCSTCTLELSCPTPPLLGSAAPRPGTRVVVYCSPSMKKMQNEINSDLQKNGKLDVGGYSYADYVVNIDSPSEYTNDTLVTIYSGGGYCPDEIPAGFSFSGSMQQLVSKKFSITGIGQDRLRAWVSAQMIPTYKKYEFEVDYSDKPEVQAAAHYFLHNQAEKGVAELMAYLEECPNDAEAIYLMGVALMNCEQYSLAEQTFRKAYSIKPNKRYLNAVSKCQRIVNDASAVQAHFQ